MLDYKIKYLFHQDQFFVRKSWPDLKLIQLKGLKILLSYTVNTMFGKSHIFEIGAGKPLVILHGGPGLDASYLLESLAPLGAFRRLIFFNQIGCTKNYTFEKKTDIDSTIQHIKEVLAQLDLGKDVGLLGHSWGTFLVIEMLEMFSEFSISEAILLNPFPLTWERLLNLGTRMTTLLEKLLSPDEKLQKIELEKNGTSDIGSQLMKIMAPLYVADSKFRDKLSFNFYDPRIESSVVSSIQGFDQRDKLKHLPKKSLILRGDHDFIMSEDIIELTQVGSTIILEGIGHSPFVECHERFLAIVGQFLSE